LIRNFKINMRIKLIRKSFTDQVDPHDLQYTKTHTQLKCVPRMSPSTTTTLNIGTFTFTESNLTVAKEPKKIQHRREKSEKKSVQKWLVWFFKKKTPFKRRKKVEPVLPFFKNAGCTNNNARCT